jgi:hypothetical protein
MEWRIGHTEQACVTVTCEEGGARAILLFNSFRKVMRVMHDRLCIKVIRILAVPCLAALFAVSALAAFKNMAIVAAASSKLSDVPLTDLAKYCKGTSKAWPDGKNFTIVIKSPDSPEMHGVLQKLFGGTPAEAKAVISKLNEARVVVKIVDSDEELLKAVEATPGAVGVVDVYAINSSVKVLRVDGKLPFDVGYALKGN